jgi:hypothetical protein
VDERYTRPQGLYPYPDIDLRKLRRLILEAKLAPCHPGADDARADLDECPICFLVNQTVLFRPSVLSSVEARSDFLVFVLTLSVCVLSANNYLVLLAVLPQPQPLQVLRQGDLHG